MAAPTAYGYGPASRGGDHASAPAASARRPRGRPVASRFAV